jgi:hypothetical protein
LLIVGKCGWITGTSSCCGCRGGFFNRFLQSLVRRPLGLFLFFFVFGVFLFALSAVFFFYRC